MFYKGELPGLNKYLLSKVRSPSFSTCLYFSLILALTWLHLRVQKAKVGFGFHDKSKARCQECRVSNFGEVYNRALGKSSMMVEIYPVAYCSLGKKAFHEGIC